MDDDDDETSISVINGHFGDVQEDAAGDSATVTPSVTPQYHMFSGAIPKDVTASASHHALILAYRDLKKRYDLLTTKDRQSPQLRRSATVSTPLTTSEWRRSARKSANIPGVNCQSFPNDSTPVTHHRVVSPQMQRQIDSRRRETDTRQETDCAETETECLKSLLWEQKKEVNRLKREVDDLRLTIAGREQKESATGTSSDDMVRAAIRQVQQMKKLLQQKNLDISQLLLKRNINQPGFYESIEHTYDLELRARSPRIISVDSCTESKVIRSIDETDSIDFTTPNNCSEFTVRDNCPEFSTPDNWAEIPTSNKSSPDLYGMPTMTSYTSPVMGDQRLDVTRDQRLEESDCGWVRLENHRTPGERSGSLNHSGFPPPQRPPFIPARHSYDNACMSVNLNTHASEQTQRVAIPHTDLLPGHKPTTSHRNIYHDGGASGDRATAATIIECPMCSQRFGVPQNSPEFQRHVDECLQNNGSTDGLPRHCPVCDDAFPATVEQKDYEMHVNRHFDDEDVVDRFDVLDFATLQHNDHM